MWRKGRVNLKCGTKRVNGSYLVHIVRAVMEGRGRAEERVRCALKSKKN